MDAELDCAPAERLSARNSMATYDGRRALRRSTSIIPPGRIGHKIKATVHTTGTGLNYKRNDPLDHWRPANRQLEDYQSLSGRNRFCGKRRYLNEYRLPLNGNCLGGSRMGGDTGRALR